MPAAKSWTAPDGAKYLTKLASWVNGEASVKTVEVTDDDGDLLQFIVVRIYTTRNWNHYVIEPHTGAVISEGHAPLERDSWAMAKKMLHLRACIA
jgi:hypothetical protein